MYKNIGSQKVAVFAWDGAAGTPKAGDAANITAKISLDGGASAATNDANPTELDATDHPGIYIFDLLQAETNADLVVITPVSSTSDITIRPIISTPTLLTVAPPTVDDILTGTVESTITVKKLFLILLARHIGIQSDAGAAAASLAFRDFGDTLDRITLSTDSTGKRLTATLDFTDL